MLHTGHIPRGLYDVSVLYSAIVVVAQTCSPGKERLESCTLPNEVNGVVSAGT